MSVGNDSMELVSLCESILEDGEVSGDEIYHLAAWLNDHPETAEEWPGHLLIGPLQDVWADRRLTRSELHEISLILLRIRKDWAKKQTQKSLVDAAREAALHRPAFNPREPKLPFLPVTTEVRCPNNTALIYDVDLRGPACRCEEWVSRRASLPELHLSRCCKHIFDVYHAVEPPEGWPGWLAAYIDLAWPPHPEKDWMVLSLRGSELLASTAPTGWVDLFIKNEEDSRYERFAYHVDEKRWAYGLKPAHDEEILQVVLGAG